MKKFESVRMDENHPEYKIASQRLKPIYSRDHDFRSEFLRDYQRIIFSEAYRRLKHKTQVFFAIDNDHVCTRNEHVNLVESVSYTIAIELGLNYELTRAISVGHDLGHAPFGHGGERILSNIAVSNGLDKFWHEKNSLHFVDNIELLENDQRDYYNLNLTYAVRDGIISHCGEVNQKYIQRRTEAIDLNDYHNPGQYNPYTYEGCVVKMSDKIAYLARDIDDALRLKIITDLDVSALRKEINKITQKPFKVINSSSIVNYFIQDVIENSCIEKGIGLSDEAFEVMRMIMKYNYDHIYKIDRFKVHDQFVELILNTISNYLLQFEHSETLLDDLENNKHSYPKLIDAFISWLVKYSNVQNRDPRYNNASMIYDLKNDPLAYKKAVIDYISGMTDNFIVAVFNELISFQ